MSATRYLVVLGALINTYASSVKLGVDEPRDHILTVLSRHAEANANHHQVSTPLKYTAAELPS